MSELSIEEINRIRIAAGAKPLPVPNRKAKDAEFSSGSSSDSEASDDEPGSTLETREAAGYDNWKKLQDEAKAKKAREARNELIKKQRDAAQRFKKLEGSGLGEDDDNGLDTRSWLMQSKKRQKKIERERARRTEEELRAREEEAAVGYTSKDLSGIRVAHEIGAFDDVEEGKVLTLRDTTIDENEEEGDELENAELVERERLGERLDLKRKGKGAYNPNEDDGEGGILQQYDETIDGKKRKRFVLDSTGEAVDEQAAKRVATDGKPGRVQVSLSILKDIPISDYRESKEVKIKKPKKGKTTKSTRQRDVDDGNVFSTEPQGNGEAMDLDMVAPEQPTSLFDDEDLQAALAKSRRDAFKKKKRMRPEDLARQLQREALQQPDAEGTEDGSGLVIDETSEFVASLERPTEPERPRTRYSPAREAVEDQSTSPEPDENGDVDMNRSRKVIEGVGDGEDGEGRIKRESDTPAAGVEQGTVGLDQEVTINRGLGSTFNLLTQRGLLEKSGAGNALANLRGRRQFLAEKRKREEAAEARARIQRERDRASGKLDRMSAREREDYARRENQQRDQLESRQMTDIFNREYKPNVQLKYIDNFGREMNQKEAFKHLSHQFHGKGSGKQKTEKHLKKVEEEKKKAAQSILDSGQGREGLNSALGATAKKQRQAGVRLA